jgi:hypothetical protein
VSVSCQCQCQWGAGIDGSLLVNHVTERRQSEAAFIIERTSIDACSPLTLTLALTLSLHFHDAELVVAPFHAAWSIV